MSQWARVMLVTSRIPPEVPIKFPTMERTWFQLLGFKKKNLNALRLSEHPPVRGENVKTFLRSD